MLLGGLADEFIALRSASGLFLGRTEVVACAVDAARFYAGWADLADVTAVAVDSITEETDITSGEWAILGPLFRLYVERETAVVVEASRGMGVELVGRASSEVASEIQQYEMSLPQLAYVEPVFTVGLPAV